MPETKRESYPAILYVNESGKQADGMEFGLYEKLARQGKMVVAVDVRGIGETRPAHDSSSGRSGDFSHLFDVETAMSSMTWFMDESLFGMRVQDVSRSVDYLLSRPDVAKADWRVVGKGAGALWVLYAAALDSRIQDATCERCLISYSALARTDRYLQQCKRLHPRRSEVFRSAAGRRFDRGPQAHLDFTGGCDEADRAPGGSAQRLQGRVRGISRFWPRRAIYHPGWVAAVENKRQRQLNGDENWSGRGLKPFAGDVILRSGHGKEDYKLERTARITAIAFTHGQDVRRLAWRDRTASPRAGRGCAGCGQRATEASAGARFDESMT